LHPRLMGLSGQTRYIRQLPLRSTRLSAFRRPMWWYGHHGSHLTPLGSLHTGRAHACCSLWLASLLCRGRLRLRLAAADGSCGTAHHMYVECVRRGRPPRARPTPTICTLRRTAAGTLPPCAAHGRSTPRAHAATAAPLATPRRRSRALMRGPQRRRRRTSI
jgi:hypothetical protein